MQKCSSKFGCICKTTKRKDTLLHAWIEDWNEVEYNRAECIGIVCKEKGVCCCCCWCCKVRICANCQRLLQVANNFLCILNALSAFLALNELNTKNFQQLFAKHQQVNHWQKNNFQQNFLSFGISSIDGGMQLIVINIFA